MPVLQFNSGRRSVLADAKWCVTNNFSTRCIYLPCSRRPQHPTFASCIGARATGQKDGRREQWDSPPLKIHPRILRWLSHQLLDAHSVQDTLRAFFQHIEIDDARLNFHMMYEREVAGCDTVKKYDEDLNTTLIFVPHLLLALATYLVHMRVYTLPPTSRSSAMSTRNSNPIHTSSQ